jgi:hypothetical protein
MADKRSKRTRGARKRCTGGKTSEAIDADNSTPCGDDAPANCSPVETDPWGEPVLDDVVAKEAPQQPTEPTEGLLLDVPAEPPVTAATDEPAASDSDLPLVADAAQEDFTPQKTFTQHHVSKILDAVLEEEIPEATVPGVNRFRYPLVIDGVLALGLLIAVAGFAIGISKMYVTHQAQQYIMASDYRAAIMLLRSTPLPQAFGVEGSNPDEALSQALYLDSLIKIDAGENENALKQLEQIRAGSKYFDQAQRVLTENFVPSDTMLECSITEEVAMQAQR